MSVVEELLEKISNLTLVEAAELKKALEEKFGVTAAAPMVVAGAAPAGAAEPQEEKTEFSVILQDIGSNKINVIKVVKDATKLGLGDSKKLVESAPTTIKENIPKAEAEKLKAELEAVGAKVEIK